MPSLDELLEEDPGFWINALPHYQQETISALLETGRDEIAASASVASFLKSLSTSWRHFSAATRAMPKTGPSCRLTFRAPTL